jgi:hypothetical protein
MRVWTLIGCAMLAAAAARGEEAPATRQDLQAARETVSKWVATQQLIFKERKEWQQGREILLTRIDLAKKEIADLETRLAQAEGEAAEAAASEARKRATIRQFEEQAAWMGRRIETAEAAVRRHANVLPDHARRKVEPLLARMPEPGRTPTVSVAERLQNVLGILNEINKFSNEIALVNEMRPLSDGKPSEVRTVYLGLGQAYFISAGGEAGVGRPAPDGWRWEPAGEIAGEINRMIEILQNKGTPRYVALPVRID